jgi:hypothetical protein
MAKTLTDQSEYEDSIRDTMAEVVVNEAKLTAAGVAFPKRPTNSEGNIIGYHNDLYFYNRRLMVLASLNPQAAATPASAATPKTLEALMQEVVPVVTETDSLEKQLALEGKDFRRMLSFRDFTKPMGIDENSVAAFLKESRAHNESLKAMLTPTQAQAQATRTIDVHRRVMVERGGVSRRSAEPEEGQESSGVTRRILLAKGGSTKVNFKTH